MITGYNFKNRYYPGFVMVSRFDNQTLTSEFESYWVPRSYGLVPHLSKKLGK